MKKDFKNIKTDVHGHLINFNDWDEELAIELAKLEDIYLTKIHWEIIYFMRSFYKKFNISPTIRILVRAISLKHGNKKGNSRYLFSLFPYQGPAILAAKIAGLPKPTKCL